MSAFSLICGAYYCLRRLRESGNRERGRKREKGLGRGRLLGAWTNGVFVYICLFFLFIVLFMLFHFCLLIYLFIFLFIYFLLFFVFLKGRVTKIFMFFCFFLCQLNDFLSFCIRLLLFRLPFFLFLICTLIFLVHLLN